MKKSILTFISVVMVSLVFTSISNAQQVPNPRVSPTMISAMTIDGAYIKIVYGMPFKRDRQVFGGLVPYGQVWRTGANEATEITLTKDVEFHGNLVPAGHYSLFTIPNENEWTVIFNRELGLWGAFNYKDEHDVVRFNVPAESLTDDWEAFRILLVNDEGNSSIQMRWERTGITIPFSVR